MAKTRFRLQVKFWLDLHKQDESELAELIAELKQQRAFSRVVRDGIRLAADLWCGNLDVLISLFPWVEEAFYERFRDQKAAPDYALREHLARLEQLLIEQGNTPVSYLKSSTAGNGSGPKPLAVPAIPGPVPDDEKDAIVVTKASTSGKATQNFLDSISKLQ